MVTPELINTLVNGGGIAVLIWLVWSLREEQRAVNTWMMQVIQDSLVREAIARGLPTPNLPPSPNTNATPSGVGR